MEEWRPELGHEPCLPGRLPDARRADFGEAGVALYADAETLLHAMQIGHFSRHARACSSSLGPVLLSLPPLVSPAWLDDVLAFYSWVCKTMRGGQACTWKGVERASCQMRSICTV